MDIQGVEIDVHQQGHMSGDQGAGQPVGHHLRWLCVYWAGSDLGLWGGMGSLVLLPELSCRAKAYPAEYGLWPGPSVLVKVHG
jgi:hypothetical protein